VIDISIIIVTFNNQTEIGSCLRSLRAALKNLRAQLIVIDNDSSDRSRDIVRTALEEFSGLHNGHIIENPANFGFTRAVNQGLEIADGEFILLLNPDTEVHSDTLDALIETIRRDPDVGVASPQFLNYDRSIQPSCRRFPRHRDILYSALGLDLIFPKSLEFNYWKMGGFDHCSRQTVEQPQGAFLLTHRSVLSDVGVLDERFPMFFSDVDWCRRMVEKEWKILFTPEVQIIHGKGSSIVKRRLEMIWSSHRSFFHYFQKYYRGPGWFVLNITTAELLIALALLRSLTHLLSHNSFGENR